jgi:hypothetical protein
LALRPKNLILGLYSIEKTSMVQKLACFLIVILAGLTSHAQTTTPATPKKGRPDIPGTFVLELGINRAQNAPDTFNLGLWGSRTINFYYQYEVRMFNSRFSFVPGFGLSLERFQFKQQTVLHDGGDTLFLKFVNPGVVDVKKSDFITNYIDVPLELRYNSKPEDPARSFRASIGGRIGYLYDSFTKVKYREDGETGKIKDKRDFNTTKIRYGLSAKIGIGNFAIMGYYNLTNLFQQGKGLSENGTVKDFNTWTVGISLSSF